MGNKLSNDEVDAEVLARRARVASMLARGMRSGAIAAAMPEVKRTLVFQDMAAVEKMWLASILEDVDKHKSEAVAHCVEVRRTAWEEWERSRRDKERRSLRKKTGGKDGGPAEESMATVEGRCGDVRYLVQVISATQEIMKIVGGYAPQESRLVDDEGADVLGRLIERLDMDELRTLDVVFKKYEAVESEKKLPAPDGKVGGDGEEADGGGD